MGSIFINEMVEDTTNKTRYRILWIAPDRKKGFWMRLNPEKMPEAFDPDWLQRELENHLFEKREDAVPGCVDEADATDVSKARRDELWKTSRIYMTASLGRKCFDPRRNCLGRHTIIFTGI